MTWLLRLGLGASIGGAGAGAMSWDEYLDTCPLQFDAAVEFAQRAADAMLEHAITHAKRTEPILVQDGPGIRVAFTARVLSTCPSFMNVGPSSSKILRTRTGRGRLKTLGCPFPDTVIRGTPFRIRARYMM